MKIIDFPGVWPLEAAEVKLGSVKIPRVKLNSDFIRHIVGPWLLQLYWKSEELNISLLAMYISFSSL